MVILFIFSIGLAYLMGSICSAIIVCRLFSLPDPRSEGSKNPGATNVLRIAGKQYAALVMVADILKGTIPVLIAKALGAEHITVAFTCLAAVVGHMYPLFFEFKGGKGVATAIGALLGFHFIVGVLVAATWLLVAKFTRYSSLASIIAITLAPFYGLLIIRDFGISPPLFFITILVLYKHKNNITRLLDGTEPKFKLKHTVIEEVMGSPKPPQSKPKKTTHKVIGTTKTARAKSPKAKKTKEVEKPAKSPTKAKPKKIVKEK
jgi:glycerol-3-phosphate acyltransferase PlsY